MHITERRLTKVDRQILKSYSSAVQRQQNYVIFVVTSFVYFGLSATFVGLIWDPASNVFSGTNFESVKWKVTAFLSVISTLVAGRTAFAEHRMIAAKDGPNRLADEDLKNGIASVHHLEVEAVVEVEELDDEGAGFLLGLKGGGVLFAMGQDLYPYSVDADPETDAEFVEMVFPSNTVDYIYGPKSGVFLDVIGTGVHLKPRSRAKWQGDGPREKHYAGPEPDRINAGSLNEAIAQAGLIEEPI